ncbi:MAG: hypothetical protein ABIN55_02955 [Aeromicrobium sp.]
MTKSKVKIPDLPRLSVNVATGTIHQPYTDHAGTAQRSSAAGVSALLAGRDDVSLCATCFPAEKDADPTDA